MVGKSSWGALVHFDEEATKTVTVFAQPVEGQKLDADLTSEGWIVEKVEFREGELEGKSYQYEVWVKRAD